MSSYLIWILFAIATSSFLVSLFIGRNIGASGAILFTCLNSLILWLISIVLFFNNIANGILNIDYNIGTWFEANLFNVYYGIKIDALTSTMLVVISTISLLAQIYSIEYMHFDPHKSRFFGYLAMFTFFMLILVSSNNLIVLFIGWEGVGICSYLLINFWYFRAQANKSSVLAVLVNKIGDLALFIGTVSIYSLANSSDLAIINNSYLFFSFFFDTLESIFLNRGTSFLFFNGDIFHELINCSTFFFIIACVGKSAQFGLHIWLPEAMEGPTPVSSLIHAATMVTAGIYLILRVSFLFKNAQTSLIICLILGSITTLFASSIGLVQFDLKKVVAYSTCSQLGYMFMGCGFKGYNFVIFHLFIHAFFKALLFLTAGYVIHLLVNEQDIRKMGGLLYISTFSYMTMGIGSLALIGFPFLSGFYSKERLLEALSLSNIIFYSSFLESRNIVWITSLFSYTTLLLTILYSFKVFSEVFYGKFNGFKRIVHSISYSELFIIVPLFILSLLSIYSGFLFYDCMIGISTDFWGSSFLQESKKLSFLNSESPSLIYSFFHLGSGSDLFNNRGLFNGILFHEDSKINFIESNDNNWFQKIVVSDSLTQKYGWQSRLSSPFYTKDLLEFHPISEYEWYISQWVVPFWTLYYLFLIFFIRMFFYTKIRIYLYSSIIFLSLWRNWFSNLVRKYVYLNRLIIYQVVKQNYEISYNYMYRVIEKGFIEQFSSYGIFNLLSFIASNKLQSRTFLVYHYLGLIIISILIITFVFIFF